MSQIRSIMERALSAVGLHVVQGSHLWEAYREIENAILMTLQVIFESVTKYSIYKCLHAFAAEIFLEAEC